MAEGVGFEPTRDVTALSGFQDPFSARLTCSNARNAPETVRIAGRWRPRFSATLRPIWHGSGTTSVCYRDR